jgi:asparagine synthase (glutamine-hydrolysing)
MVRDRLGVKPLFTPLLADGFLVFGSELKTMTAWPGFRRDIDDWRWKTILATAMCPSRAPSTSRLLQA